jgi:hypothetical protein
MDHAEATHTKGETVYSSLGAEELDLPLTHPATVLASSDKDELDARLWQAHLTVLPYFLTNAAAALKLLVARATRRARNRLARRRAP